MFILDRPKQKTFTIVFLVSTMLFTMILGIYEFASIGIGNYFTAFSNRHQDITKGEDLICFSQNELSDLQRRSVE